MNTIRSKKGATVWFLPGQYDNPEKGFISFKLAKSFTNNSYKEIAQFTFLIDVDFIKSIFRQSKLNEDAFLQLIADDGTPIIDNGNDIGSSKWNLTFTYPCAHNGWSLKVTYPLQKLHVKLLQMIKLPIAIIVLFILLGIIGIYIIVNDIGRPISILIKNIFSWNKDTGKYSFEKVKGAIEIVKINEAFVTMADEINRLIKEDKINQQKKQKAEMIALQNQISPHFLYNTLNSIRLMAVIQKQDNIKTMIDSLNKMLSYAIRDVDKPVYLKDELSIVESYVNIQRVRFQNFKFYVNVDEAIMDAEVFKFMIQPIVENSIIHGLGKCNGVLEISVEGYLLDNGDMEIIVSDNGGGIDDDRLEEIRDMLENEKTFEQRVGLLNIQQRIHMHFGSNYGLFISSRKGEGTKVKILIKYKHKIKEGTYANSNDS